MTQYENSYAIFKNFYIQEEMSQKLRTGTFHRIPKRSWREILVYRAAGKLM
jgi:hypothetical protein